jgi:O-antigen/teichoic acid export membrane protein
MMKNVKGWVFWGAIAALVVSLFANALTLYYLGEEARAADVLHILKPAPAATGLLSARAR